MKKLLFTVVALFIFARLLPAQEFDNYILSNYEGRRFQISFMQNEWRIVKDGVEMKIFISARQTSNIQVQYPKGPIYKFRIPADSVLVLPVSQEYYYPYSESISQNTVRIEADFPILVYGFCSQEKSSDSYAAIPVENWGKEYVAISMPNDQYNEEYFSIADSLEWFTPRQSEFLVISDNDGAEVTITPASETEKGKPAKVPFKVTLNAGQSYLVKSLNASIGAGDMSGSIIRSTKPVGVLSGHVRSAVPIGQPRGMDSKDHLVEMLVPTNTWGNKYISAPFGLKESGDYFKVISIQPNTKVSYQTDLNPIEFNLNDNFSWRFISNITKPAIWQSDKPVEIGQFMPSASKLDPDWFFDPSLVLLPPVEQYVQRVVFYTPGGVFGNPTQYRYHYVTLIYEAAAKPFISIDGKLLDTLPDIKKTQILNEPYYYSIIELEQGQHDIYTPVGRFSGILWGRGEFDSYAMALGSSLVNYGARDSLPPAFQYSERCGILNGFFRDSVEANASGMSYATVIWDSTSNYDIQLVQPGPGEDKVQFTATPIDKMQDGQLLIEARDRRGNVSFLRYKYDGLKIDAPKEIVFSNISWNDSTCIEFEVVNNGKRSINFESYTFKSDPRLHVYFDQPTNVVIRPGKSLKVTVCFTPMGNVADPFQTLILDLNCDTEIKVLVRGSVVGVDLTTRGHDFGEVIIGDTVCAQVGVRIQGNVPVGIDSLVMNKEERAFAWDTTGQFPKPPNQFADYPINVCFAPTVRGPVTQSATVANTYSLPHNPIAVTGVGVAPLIDIQSINWGKRRVGSRWDTTFAVRNTGNYVGKISFAGFVSNNINQEALDGLESIDGTVVPKNSSEEFSTTFIPPIEGAFLAEAKYGVDWKFHDTLLVVAQGVGTIPKISVNNIDFGTVEIYTKRDTLERIISSRGSEDLTVDSIYAGKGDVNDFIVDYAALKNLLIAQETDYKAAISFKPTDFGNRRLELIVVNDAAPNYKRKNDTLVLYGFSVMPDERNIPIEISPADFYACGTDTIFAKIQNKNDFYLNLTEVEITRESGDFNYKSLSSDPLPVKIESGAEHIVPILVQGAANEGGKLRVKFVFSDGYTRESEVEVVPKVLPVYAAFAKDIAGFPGDTIHVTIKGKFPYPADREKSLRLAINLSHKFLYVITKDPALKVVTSTGQIDVPYTISRKLDSMFLIIPNIPADAIDFETTIKCLVLLPDTLNSDLELQAYSTTCYTDSSTFSEINIGRVCIFDLRQIEIIANLPTINVAPNPTDSKITIKYTLPERDEAIFTIYDALGREAILPYIKNSTVGENELTMDVSGLPAGVYTLGCRSKNLNEKIRFIISK